MSDKDLIRADLRADEGFRANAYYDSEGFLTIGIGRLIDPRRGRGITESEALYLLDNDIDLVCDQLDARLSWWRKLTQPRRRALINMAFQLGISGLLRFRRMLAALRDGDYETAAAEALDSKWATQTPDRAKRVAALIRG